MGGDRIHTNSKMFIFLEKKSEDGGFKVIVITRPSACVQVEPPAAAGCGLGPDARPRGRWLPAPRPPAGATSHAPFTQGSFSASCGQTRGSPRQPRPGQRPALPARSRAPARPAVSARSPDGEEGRAAGRAGRRAMLAWGAEPVGERCARGRSGLIPQESARPAAPGGAARGSSGRSLN